VIELRPVMTSFSSPALMSRLLLCGLVLIAAHLPRKTCAAEVWLCAGERISALMRPQGEWPVVKQHLSGIKLYIDQLNRASPEELAALVDFLKEHRYQVAVELGGCLDFAPMDDTAGEWSARHELAKLAKFTRQGARLISWMWTGQSAD
jgi:hypothetical protein